MEMQPSRPPDKFFALDTIILHVFLQEQEHIDVLRIKTRPFCGHNITGSTKKVYLLHLNPEQLNTGKQNQPMLGVPCSDPSKISMDRN